MPSNPHHPHHPIIYVRGFAGTQGEIEETVADPYMGFNIGSTKSRMAWTGELRRHFFESPLVRLMSDHRYEDVFVGGEDLTDPRRQEFRIPYRSIVIHRYYDEASTDFGTGSTPPIEHFAKGLSDLIIRLRDRVCAVPSNRVNPQEFRVHLVAHSMGGLICRAFLQNPALGSAEARGAVDKVFTYATPHNGIDLRIVRNVPGWLTFGDVDNFNRGRMAKYLGLSQSDDVSVVHGFPPQRIFNLVGTNPADYLAAKGVSAWAAGPASDGLVRIENATTHGPGPDGKDVTSPRAFVHRSHSGHYGIVNSEEGYQNLVRFLFGSLRVDGFLDVDQITLPPEVRAQKEAGKTVRASYQFEAAVSIRACQWHMTRREAREHSAIFRTYDELLPEGADGTRSPDRGQSPHLFSTFLDPAQSVMRSGSVGFALDLKVLVPDYVVDGILFLKRHFEGGAIYQEQHLFEALPDASVPGGWRIKHGLQSVNPGRPGSAVDVGSLPGDKGEAVTLSIRIAQRSNPGLSGALRLELRPWS
jgi:hypothetical protein